MGTTIRRQPINFDIPKSPDYKFLNITNFRGLDISSNPFELAANTASDCLNVYVDETNTLTTRPRLEKKIDTPIDGKHIGTYNLHNGYLLHYVVDGAGVMKTLIDGRLVDITGKDLTPDESDITKKEYYKIPTTKCTYFEQGDKIYLLDGERYMIISENILSGVEGYVPTTYVVDLNGERRDVEGLNLLSNKYKELYYWDGEVATLQQLNTRGAISVANEAVNKVKFDIDLSPYEYVQQYDDLSVLLREKNTNKLWYGEYMQNISSLILRDCKITVEENSPVLSSRLSKLLAYKNGYWWEGRAYLGNGEWGEPHELIESDVELYCDNDSFWAIAEVEDPEISGELRINFARQLKYYNGAFHGAYANLNNVDSKKSFRGKSVLPIETQTTEYPLYIEGYYLDDSSTRRIITHTSEDSVGQELFTLKNIPETAHGSFNHDGTIYYVWWLDAEELNVWFYNIVTKTPTRHSFPRTIATTMRVLKNNNILLQNEDRAIWLSSVNDLNTLVDTKITLDGDILYNDGLKILVTNGEKPFSLYAWTDESYIELIFELRESDDSNHDWLTKRKDVKTASLVTRFDNNYWFASKNRYYRSQNNDPTYFPITEYNDLGDSNEEITGFNLANDTTLIAYKKNRVYLVQPFTSSLNTTEYTITESKNTVGNTAIGAPIVTTLTEIPLQINNDGVYGLSQLSNVSSTERIADLMSEPINERWLNIDDALITNAQTLNRLYWTYIILPDVDNERTMVYLLDNRTNSWYYWELPIIVTDSFVKDNRTELVDTSGNIYYLTATDIVDINYTDEKITKYYDEGNLLIPWYWQSQVLPLGTMNYSKRLVNTTFILTDTDESDGYGLQYNFKVFRKLASSTPEKEISDKLTLVRSTTKKTNISKFGFIQLRLSNLTQESRDYEAFENNKLRLVGLGLKYVLLEGLIR